MASFKSAFASARKAGKKTFSWNGKSYNTKLASGNGTPAKAPRPSGNPSKGADGSSKPAPRKKTSAPKADGAKKRVAEFKQSEAKYNRDDAVKQKKAKAKASAPKATPKKSGGLIKSLRMDTRKYAKK